MPKKICHVTSLHSPDDTRIFHKECCSLANYYDVTLIAPNVTNYRKYGINVVGVELPKNRFSRLTHLNAVLKKALEIDADIYHFHDPELMNIGLKIKKYGKKVIFDSHEDVPAQILGKQYIPKLLRKSLSYIYSYYEKKHLSQYDALVTVTPHIVERLSKINSNTEMITNFPVVKNKITDRNTISFQDRQYVSFIGAVSPHYRHEHIICALENCSVKYLLAGPAESSYLEKLKSCKGWDKVEYRGVIPAEDVYSLLDQSFAGLVIPEYRPNAGYKRGTIGVLKLFEYMLAGIPVIATDFDLWKEIIEGNECGICVNPFSDQEISDAINFYLLNPETAKKHGENGRRAVLEHYCWATQESKLLELYRRLTN